MQTSLLFASLCSLTLPFQTESFVSSGKYDRHFHLSQTIRPDDQANNQDLPHTYRIPLNDKKNIQISIPESFKFLKLSQESIQKPYFQYIPITDKDPYDWSSFLAIILFPAVKIENEEAGHISSTHKRLKTLECMQDLEVLKEEFHTDEGSLTISELALSYSTNLLTPYTRREIVYSIGYCDQNFFKGYAVNIQYARKIQLDTDATEELDAMIDFLIKHKVITFLKR